MTRLMRSNLIALFLGIIGLSGLMLAGTGCGERSDHKSPAAMAPDAPAAPSDPHAKPYPLKTCIVSGEELGKMGEPLRFTYKAQEIRLCCKGCEKKFQADAD